ncbi:MAG: Bromodomain adjacent to zinc finger domain protein 1A, partial [Paramarteilia canceri]
MPLLVTKNFERRPAPDSEKTPPDAKFFYFSLTGELFEKHEDYFDRYIQCFSNIWTCKYTGKTHLTYEKALQSEKESLIKLNKIPTMFCIPILIIIENLPPHSSVTKLASKVNFLLSIFLFPKESVEMRKFAQNDINKMLRFKINHAIVDERIEIHESWTKSKLNEFCNKMKYKLYTADMKTDEASIKMVKAKDRHSNYFNSDSILYFINNCTLKNKEGFIEISDAIKQQYDIPTGSMIIKYFPFSDPKLFTIFLKMMPENNSSLNNQTLKYRRSSTIDQYIKSSPTTEDIPSKKSKLEEEKKQSEIEKKKIQEAKKKEELIEKEKQRLKALKTQFMSKWNVPRDDFLLEDSKDPFMPTSISEDSPVSPCWTQIISSQPKIINDEMLLDIIEISEFLDNFVDLFGTMLSEEFPKGIDVTLLESAVADKSPDSSYGEILQCFMSLIISLLKEEAANFSNDDSTEALNNVEDFMQPFIEKSIENSKTSKFMYGCPLTNLVLDNCTITEILRLHLINSGSRNFSSSRSNQAKIRGCIQYRDDPGIMFLMEHSDVVENLKNITVYELEASSKVSILKLLMHQILLSSLFRDHILEHFDNYASARSQFRTNIRKDQNLERLETIYFTNLNQENTEENENKPGDLDKNHLTEAAAPLFITRNRDIDSDVLYEKITSNPEEWSLSKSQHLREELSKNKENLSIQCMNILSHCRAVSFGIDSHFRNYYYSKYYKGLLVILNQESKMMIKKAASFYQSSTEGYNLMKDKYNIDILDTFKIGNKLLSNILINNLANAHKFSETIPNIILVKSKEGLDSILQNLNIRGVREKTLKQSLGFKKEMLMYAIEVPQLEREKPSQTLNKKGNNLESNSEIKPDNDESNKELSGISLVVSDLLLSLADLDDKLRSCQMILEDLSSSKFEMEIQFETDLITNHKLWHKWMPKSVIAELIENIQNKDLLIDESSPEPNEKFVFTTMKQFLVYLASIVDPDYLIEPLGLSRAKRKKYNQVNKSEKIVAGTTKIMQRSAFFNQFTNKLLNCTSLSQLSVYFTILENSVAWNRSITNQNCYTCRKKYYTDAQDALNDSDLAKLIVCNNCERGFHKGCIKQKYARQPLATGEWFCNSCRGLVIVNTTPVKKNQWRNATDLDEEYEENKQNDSDDGLYNIYPRRAKQPYFDEENKETDTKSVAVNNHLGTRKPTRAVNSSILEALRSIITFILEQNEVDKLRNDAKVYYYIEKFSEIFNNLNYNGYSNPTTVVEEITEILESLKELLPSSSENFLHILSLENKFISEMNKKDL